MSQRFLLSAAHSTADICSISFTGVQKYDGIPGLWLIGRASVIWKYFVHLIHPARFTSAVKLIKLMDSFYIITIINRSPGIFQLNLSFLADAASEKAQKKAVHPKKSGMA